MKTRINQARWTSVTLAVTASLLLSRVAVAQTPTPSAAPVTMSLPTDAFDTSVPIGTVIIEPVVATNIDAGLNYVGFQGDFTFDETVVALSNPPMQKAGLTGGNWNVTGSVLPGPGPIRTARVSAFSNDFTPLSGAGTLYQLRMLRVSSTPGASKLLSWAASPDNFFFIDSDLSTHDATQDDGLITITGPTPTATATATASATSTATSTPTATVAASATPTSPPQILYGISNGFATPAANEIYQIDPTTAAVSNNVQVTLAGFTIFKSQALAARQI